MCPEFTMLVPVGKWGRLKARDLGAHDCFPISTRTNPFPTQLGNFDRLRVADNLMRCTGCGWHTSVQRQRQMRAGLSAPRHESPTMTVRTVASISYPEAGEQ
jgi:hypothetical protein